MTVHFEDDAIRLLCGDALAELATLPDGCVDCIVTSPPYFGLRDYGNEGQLGGEDTIAQYVQRMAAIMHEAKRTLKDGGSLWLNLGDSYAGSGKGRNANGEHVDGQGKQSSNIGSVAGVLHKASIDMPPKNLMGIPWRVAFALQDDGWVLRNEIIWHIRNKMPTSANDRLAVKHETVFLFTKGPHYHFDLDAILVPMTTTSAAALSWDRDSKEAQHPGSSTKQHRRGRSWQKRKESGAPLRRGTRPDLAAGDGGFATHHLGANPGDVWDIPNRPFTGGHFATFPVDLPLRCIRAGCPEGGTVLDPSSGSGTTGLAAITTGCRYIGIDLNTEYLDLSLDTRLKEYGLLGPAA